MTRGLRAACGLMALLCLSACVAVQQGPAATRVVEASDVSGVASASTSADAGSRGDLVTASDEPEADKRARIRLELAGAYFSQGQMATALDEVKRALAMKPNNASAFNLRGLIYAAMDERALAEDSFKRALQLAPGDADTQHNYAWYLCRLRRFGEAQVLFTSALAQPQYRNASKTLLAQGICQARAGDWTQAEKTLLHSYELDAANPATAVNLAEVLMRRGEYERARFYVGRVNASPDLSNAETLWLAARIEQRRGNREGVDEWGAQLRKRFPTSSQAAAFERGQFDDE